MIRVVEECYICNKIIDDFLLKNNEFFCHECVEISTKGVAKMERLTKRERQAFLRTHEKHLKSFGDESRKKYLLENIVEVKRNVNENCFEVYYKNGDWWKYTVDGKWY